MSYIPELLISPEELLLYLRKSRSDDPLLSVEEVLSKHETMLDEWCIKNIGGKVPEENKFREIVSGETIEDRPEIKKVLNLIESPKYKAIIVVEVQRLSRGDLEDAGRLIKLLRYTSTKVITPTKTYDLNEEYDRDFFERELKRGNDFLEYQKRIMNRGKLLSVQEGNYIGSVPPYGFDKIWVTDGKRKCPTLAPNENAQHLYTAYDLFLHQNWGLTKICNHYDSLGIPPPKGKYWSPSGLKTILKNIHNIGKVKWNWRKVVNIVEDGEIKRTRPKQTDYLIYDGKQPAIIPEEWYYATLEKLGSTTRAKSSTQLVNPLAGLLFCQCGRAMSLRVYKNKDGSQRCAPRLSCDGQTHCNSGSCLFSEIIDRLEEILKESINNFEIELKKISTSGLDFQKARIEALKKRLKDIETKELLQWEQQSDPDPTKRMPQEIFQKLNKKLQKDKETVITALKQEHITTPSIAYYEEKIARFKEALSALTDSTVTADRKNNLLKACISRIEYTKEKPERLTGSKKRISINGKRVRNNNLPIGASWTNPPIQLTVTLKV